MKSWNPIFNLIMSIKKDYLTIDPALNDINLDSWLKALNTEYYNSIFKYLHHTQKDKFVIIRYEISEVCSDLWENKDSLYREARSCVIDIINEQIVIAPFRKFFNINEIEENKTENIIKEIQTAKTIEITDKLDGSMQCVRYYENDFFISGSKSIDPNTSWRLIDGLTKLTDSHKNMIKDHVNYTFIFEYISLKDAHIVKYTPQDEGMYLIGIRNVNNGQMLNYNEINILASQYNVPVTKIEPVTFDEILSLAKVLPMSQKEGWVLNIDSHYIKIKCDDYVKLGRLLQENSSVNTIIKNIADNKFDDMISKIPAEYKDKIINLSIKIYEYINTTNLSIEDYYNNAPKTDKKSYMIWVTNNCPIQLQGYLRKKYLGEEYNLLKTTFKNSVKYKTAIEIGVI